MVHEIELCNGEAKAYRNRYIKTDYFEAVSNNKPPSLGDPRSSMANTHIVAHARTLLALEETHLPIALDHQGSGELLVEQFLRLLSRAGSSSGYFESSA